MLANLRLPATQALISPNTPLCIDTPARPSSRITARGRGKKRCLIAPAEDQEEVHIEDEPVLMAVKMAPVRGQPTAKQWEEHRWLPLPYRLWC